MFDRSLVPDPRAYYGQYFPLKGSKAKVMVQCCFHADKTASLSLDLVSGRFNCFGCEAGGGDVLDFHMLKTGLSFVEAAKDLGAWVDTRQDTPEQLAERKLKIEQADREHKARQEQAAREEQEAAQAIIPLVASILTQCTPPMFPPPYVQSKGLQVHNLLSIEADRLHRFKDPDGKAMNYGLQGQLTVAALETLDGQMVALQVFDGAPDGKGKYDRRYIGRPSVLAGYYRIGDWAAPGVIVVTEGVADAVSCFEATGYPVIAAGSVARLEQAAQAVKEKYPAALLVIVGDNDSHGKGQAAARSAAKAVNGVCVIPSGEGVKDANDMHRKHGLERVKQMIDAAIEKKKAAPSREESAARNAPTSAKSIADDQTRPKPVLRVVTAAELVCMALPPRDNLLSPWLPMQGLAMVYAPRGIGKTFFALNVAYAVASGGVFLSWEAPRACRVLYIDGEMPAISMKERLSAIITTHTAEAEGDAIRILTPDLQNGCAMPDLATIEGQEAVEPFLEGVTLIVIDNISTLCRSGRENESEGWIVVQEWALRQRSAGRSVLFVHHAGKGGNQRGTSKREDVLDTVINLKRPIDYNPADGASFEVHFEKTRGFSGEDAEPLSCRLVTDEHNLPAWSYSKLEDSTFDKVVSLFNEGMSQSEIAGELDINKSSVSRHIKKARAQGLIQDAATKAKPVISANYAKARGGE